LRDLWNDREVYVAERAGTRQLTRWDLLAARVAPDEDGALRLDGGIYLLPSRLKKQLLDLRAHAKRLREDPGFEEDRLFREAAPLIHGFWLAHVVHRTLPTVVTAEGDLMEFGKVVFDVTDREALIAAPNGHSNLVADDDEGWTWVEEYDFGWMWQELGLERPS
jgi:hypothetical protein